MPICKLLALGKYCMNAAKYIVDGMADVLNNTWMDGLNIDVA